MLFQTQFFRLFLLFTTCWTASSARAETHIEVEGLRQLNHEAGELWKKLVQENGHNESETIQAFYARSLCPKLTSCLKLRDLYHRSANFMLSTGVQIQGTKRYDLEIDHADYELHPLFYEILLQFQANQLRSFVRRVPLWDRLSPNPLFARKNYSRDAIEPYIFLDSRIQKLFETFLVLESLAPDCQKRGLNPLNYQVVYSLIGVSFDFVYASEVNDKLFESIQDCKDSFARDYLAQGMDHVMAKSSARFQTLLKTFDHYVKTRSKR